MRCSVLTDEQIAAIHEASLRILGEVGVHLPHDEALGLLGDAGARIDRDAQRAWLPTDVVDQALASAGKQFTLYGRDESKIAPFGVGQRNYNSIAGEAHWLDQPGGPRRPATLRDVATAALFGDALDQMTMVGAMADPSDVPPQVACVEVMAQMLRNTTRPLQLWYHDRASTRYLVEMMIAVRGSERAAAQRPLCYPFLEPISPLRFPFDGVDLLFETARLNLPVPIGPMAQMGLSAPMGLAGTMAQENAEILAGICITQVIREGMPVCYGGICHAFDMGTTQLIFSGPEQAIFGVAMTQMGKSYGLPVYINVGLTDSKRPDAQAGLEVAATMMLGAGAGADVLGHMGIAGVDQAASLDMLVLQNEAISYVESACRELDFSADAFGFDEIAEAASGDSFIGTEHTARRFRDELWFPSLLDREFYDAWRDAGAVSTEQRIAARKSEILATHEPEPMPGDMSAAVDEIVAAARRELVR